MALIVTGNESGDLDSVASVLAFTALLRTIPELQSRFSGILPLVRCPRSKYYEDHMVTQLFLHTDVSMDELIFSVAGEPEAEDKRPMMKAEGTKLVLLDHNTVDFFNKPYWESRSILSLIDHHEEVEAEVKEYMKNDEALKPFYINEGPTRCSTCSIIAEVILHKLQDDGTLTLDEELQQELDTLQSSNGWVSMVKRKGEVGGFSTGPLLEWQAILKLLLGVLIEDSKGFEKELKNIKWQPADRTVYKLITNALELTDRDLFEFVYAVKDIQKCHRKALRKVPWPSLLAEDQKVFHYGTLTLPWSVIPIRVNDTVAPYSGEIETAVMGQMEAHRVSHFILQSKDTREGGRILWIFSKKTDDSNISDALARSFSTRTVEPQWNFDDLDVKCYKFDESYSRKRIEPLIRAASAAF